MVKKLSFIGKIKCQCYNKKVLVKYLNVYKICQQQ